MSPQVIFAAFSAFILLLFFGSGWVHRRSQRPHGRVIHFLESCRRALAFEPEIENEPATCEWVWSLPRLYSNKSGKLLLDERGLWLDNGYECVLLLAGTPTRNDIFKIMDALKMEYK